jgi:glycerol-3-phosphate acyltransferase PlsY
LGPALIGVGIFALVFGISRYVSLGSIVAAAAFPMLALLMPHTPRTSFDTAVLFVIPFIVILKHHQNIARLMSGSEYRFGKARTAKTGSTTA